MKIKNIFLILFLSCFLFSSFNTKVFADNKFCYVVKDGVGTDSLQIEGPIQESDGGVTFNAYTSIALSEHLDADLGVVVQEHQTTTVSIYVDGTEVVSRTGIDSVSLSTTRHLSPGTHRVTATYGGGSSGCDTNSDPIMVTIAGNTGTLCVSPNIGGISWNVSGPDGWSSDYGPCRVVKVGNYTLTVNSSTPQGYTGPVVPGGYTRTVTDGGVDNFDVNYTPLVQNLYRWGGSCGACTLDNNNCTIQNTSNCTVNSDCSGLPPQNSCNTSSMSGTLAGPATCTIQAGSNSCNINLNWSINNPVASSTYITAPGMANILATNSNASSQSSTNVVSVPAGGRVFTLSNNGIPVAVTANIVPTCQAGSTWNGNICASNSALVADLKGWLSPYTTPTDGPVINYPVGTLGHISWSSSGYTVCYLYTNGNYSGYSTLNQGDIPLDFGGGTFTYLLSCNDGNTFGTDTITFKPIVAAASTPTGLTASCSPDNTQATFSWNAAANATDYLFRLNDQSNDTSACSGGWYCSEPPDYQRNPTGTSITLPVVKTHPYSWWVHGNNSMGYSAQATRNITCGATGNISQNSACIIPSGGSTCSQTLNWSTQNPGPNTSAVTSLVTPPYSGNDGPHTFTNIPYNPSGVIFYLYNNSDLLNQTTVSPACVGGTSWDGVRCAPTTIPTGAITPNGTCTISVGQNVCTQSLTWVTLNPDGAHTSVLSSPSSSPGTVTQNNGTQSFTVPYNSSGVNFTLSNAGNPSGQIANYVVTTTCANGLAWNGVLCASNAVPTSGSLTGPTSCTIMLGQDHCNIPLTWTIVNPTTTPTQITATGMSNIPVRNATTDPLSGTQSVPVPITGNTFYLYDGGSYVAQTSSNITATCAGGTHWGGSTCVANTVPVMSGTINLQTPCTIPMGSSTCDVVVAWTITNPVGTPTAIQGAGGYYSNVSNSLTASQNGTKTISVDGGGDTFTLWNNAQPLGNTGLIAGTCESGSAWDGAKCASTAVAPSISASSGSSNSTTNLTIYTGASVDITWSAGGSDGSCTGTNFSTGNSSTGTVTLSPTSTTTYTVSCNPSGLHSSVIVTVKKKPTFIEN